MKFGSWCSKGQAILRNLRRFWPAMVVASIWLLLSVLPYTTELAALKTESSDWDSLGPELEEHYMVIANATGLHITLYGSVCAMLLMQDNFKTRYAWGIGSFPQTREDWLLGVLFSGLVLFLIPQGVTTAVLSLLAGETYTYVLLWSAGAVVYWLYGFAVGILAAVLAGTVLGAIVTGLVLAFGGVTLELLADEIIQSLLMGVYSEDGLLCLLSPLMLTDKAVWIQVLVAVGLAGLMLVLAFVLYRKRDIERAGYFLAFPRLKPAMKLLCTCVLGILLGVVLKEVYRMFDYIGSPWLVLSWLLPGFLIARLVTEMAVEKTTRIIQKRQLLSYGFCAVAVVGLVCGPPLDPFGIATYVPSREDVASVEVENGRYEGSVVLTQPESIDAVISLHHQTLNNWDGRHEPTDQYLRTVISLVYTMNSGVKVRRTYRPYLSPGWENYTPGGENHPYLDEVFWFYNGQEWLLWNLGVENQDLEVAVPLILSQLNRIEVGA